MPAAVDVSELELEALRSLSEANDEAALEAWRLEWLGRRGRLTGVLRGLRDLPVEERPQAGAAANRLKGALEAALEGRREELSAATASRGSAIDVTLPGRRGTTGSLHPVTLTRRMMERAFRDMGFDVIGGGTHIIPILIGDAVDTLRMWQGLFDAGV